MRFKDTNGAVYAIELGHIVVPGIDIRNVKIGKTKNINATKSQYERSHTEVRVLDLWKPNKDVKLSQCERGVHKIAEHLACKRKGEVFVFPLEDYEEFSRVISLFLEKTSIEKPHKEKKKEWEVDLVEEAKDIDFTGRHPKAVRFKDQIFKVSSWRDATRVIVKKIYEEVDDFSRAKGMKGRTRIYISTNENDVIGPIDIPNSPYYVMGHASANQHIAILRRLLDMFNYDKDEVKIILEE